MQVIHPDCAHIYLAVSFQKCFEAQLRLFFQLLFLDLLAKIKIIMSVYFLLDIFAMFAGTILLRHDPEVAVPLQSIGWNMAFYLADNSKMVKPKKSLTLGDGLYTQYHPTMMFFVVARLNCMLSIAFAYVPMFVPLIPFRVCFSFITIF